MGIIKKIYYFIANKYHMCSMCNGHGYMLVGTFEKYKRVEKLFVDGDGKITIKCPACNASGLIWGNIKEQ